MHLKTKVQQLRNVKTFTAWLKQTKRLLTTVGNRITVYLRGFIIYGEA